MRTKVYNSPMGKIFVIGGANIDLQGSVKDEIIMHDSNIGRVSYSFGGVARNIAENLCLLGEDVSFCSIFGNDSFGKDMFSYCRAVGMDLSYSKTVEANSSMYLAVMDKDNDMVLGINDMRLLENLDNSTLSKVLDSAGKDDIILLDTNLNEEQLGYCFNKAKAPVYVDPISINKAGRIKNYLSRIELLKPNAYEAGYLSGIPCDTKENIKKNLEYFLDQGVKKIVISLGKEGFAFGEKGNLKKIAYKEVEMKNATGAGDSFLAGLVSRLNRKESLEEACKFASGCSVLTILSVFTVSENMSEENVKEIVKNTEFNIEVL